MNSMDILLEQVLIQVFLISRAGDDLAEVEVNPPSTSVQQQRSRLRIPVRKVLVLSYTSRVSFCFRSHVPRPIVLCNVDLRLSGCAPQINR
jgi:hypothetical protein